MAARCRSSQSWYRSRSYAAIYGNLSDRSRNIMVNLKQVSIGEERLLITSLDRPSSTYLVQY